MTSVVKAPGVVLELVARLQLSYDICTEKVQHFRPLRSRRSLIKQFQYIFILTDSIPIILMALLVSLHKYIDC